MKCCSCGKEIADGIRFCTLCGAPQAEPEAAPAAPVAEEVTEPAAIAVEELIAEPVPEVVAPKPSAPGSAGQVKLHGVEPKTAAMLMAIVADKMNKPLNELRFISIKEAE